MNILFRVDSSYFIGTGHIMRDLVLAKQYSKDNIFFAVRDLKGNINFKVDEAGYKKILLKSNDIEELDTLIKKLDIDMIIIDHYGIDYEFEKKLKELNPNLKVFIFDDTYEKHYCDILLNHNISANEKKYEDLVPNTCELRCGAKYTLLRGEFFKIKRKPKRKKNKLNVFLAMGGADHSNINIKILNVLKEFKKLHINIVSTTANKNLKSLENYCKKNRFVTLHINSNKIATLINNCDFAIVTPSVTVNEVYFLEKPIVAIKTAQNQIDMFNFLKKDREFVISRFNKEKLEITINTIMKRFIYGKY